MEDFKHTPDEILANIKAQEAKEGRGRLKVFFGMAPGVGKTYAMLEAARADLEKGTDVLAGIVETHGREDTRALLDGMPVLPRKAISYRGVDLEEFDLEEALRRHPQLILVDELAHTNAPGSRHAKRFQDVEELLAHGIDVYTTLNVQHLESRADTVASITGATVRETVPDSILTNAAACGFDSGAVADAAEGREGVYAGPGEGRGGEFFQGVESGGVARAGFADDGGVGGS